MNLKFAMLLIFLIVVVFVSGCIGEQPAPAQPVEGKIIEITSSGFNPDTLTINAGETVTFVNKDTALHWPATDPHPGHNQYPGKGGCIVSTFDACRGLAQGETFSFTFNLTNQTGWTYHDHLDPKFTGRIIVQ